MSERKSEGKAEDSTVKAKAKKVLVLGPQKAGPSQERAVKPTAFRERCDSGDIPVALTHLTKENGIRWKVDFEGLDYQFYLPLFFQGLTETTFPYERFAIQGIHGMLDNCGLKIIPVIPQLIPHIKNGLNTRNEQVMCTTLKVVRHMVMSADGVGEALVPYFRQILRVFNLFRDKKENLGDHIDLTVTKEQNVAHLMKETLEMFERHGGKDAFKRIKSIVPTYESCM